MKNKKLIALLLSAFFLPGLGQVHLGKKKRGWFFILLSLSTLILTFSKYMMGLLKVTQMHPHLRLNYAHISNGLIEAFWLEKNSILLGTILIFFIWLWGVLDVWLDR